MIAVNHMPTPSELQFMSARQLLIPISKDDDFIAIQQRLFSIGAGWQGATLDTLTQEIETLRPKALLANDSGKISLVMFDEDIEVYNNALTISANDLLTVSLSNFKQRIYQHQQKAQRKRAFNQSLNAIKQIPDDALNDEIMTHIDALRKLAKQHISY